MTESMHKYMQVGLIHMMAYPATIKGEGPIVETVKKIVLDDYFDAIEVTRINDPEARRQVAEMIRCGHMAVAYAGQPRLLTQGLNINDLDEDKRQFAVSDLKAGIDEAYEIGAVAFAFLSGKYEEATREQSFAQLVKSTRELCTYAKSKGDMKVALEVFDYDIDKKALIGPVALAKRFAETIRPEFANFGLMVDCSHIPMLRESYEENLLPIRDYIIHAHMGNTVIDDPAHAAYGDMHPRFGFPNSENDVLELRDYLKVLLDIGFLNTEHPPIVSFEVKPWGDEDSDIVIANAKRTLNRAWAMLEK